MREYAILVNDQCAAVAEQPNRRPHRVEVVPYGFCWSALLTVLWAMWHGLWGTVLALGTALLIVDQVPLLLPYPGPQGYWGVTAGSLIYVASLVAFGFVANDVRRFELTRLGWRQTARAAAPSATAAREAVA